MRSTMIVVPGNVEASGLIASMWVVEKDEIEGAKVDLTGLDLSYPVLASSRRFIAIDALFNRVMSMGTPGSAGLAKHLLANAEIIAYGLRSRLIAFPRTIVSDGRINRYMLAIGFYRGRWTPRWYTVFHGNVLIPTYR